MNAPKASVFYLTVFALCFAAACFIAYDFITTPKTRDASQDADAIFGYDVSELADSALRTVIVIPSADFSPKAGTSPFRMFGAVDPAAVTRKVTDNDTTGKQTRASRRPRLRLKGLMKNPPMAILEDSRGQTHIKGVGESALNTEVIAITNTSVTVKDSSGTYQLTVEESR